MDTQTRNSLKSDAFVNATRSSIGWAEENRRAIYMASIIVVVLLLIVLGGWAWNQHRNTLAQADFGAAMTVYNSPIAEPGVATSPGEISFPTSADRARAAANKFAAVANNFSFTQTAANARYFSGLTYMEAGDNASAESALKTVASGWCRNLADLSKTALATLYHNTGRDSAAIDMLNQVAAKPSDTVSANQAKLELAEMYDATNKHDDAKKIYAELKDKDKDGIAGRIAASKLTPQK
jgi:tetratricopeptide (TPR) repeat protein